ncbi:MAG: hypothetical protein U9M92_02815 [Patescibacteria group bacterium]|nr:hypothetical protein [Patescibacteria group bacterium]
MSPFKWPTGNRAAFLIGIIASAVVSIMVLSAAAVFAFLNQDKILNYLADRLHEVSQMTIGGNE